MALSTSATESLLRAVDIIASSKLGEVSYDQTIICTIVDNSEVEKRGFYTVTDGKVRFKAYTDVTTYKIGDQIRVTIPNGDFNAKKYIDGSYVADDDSLAPITYISPLDSFLSMAELESSVQNVKKALKANDSNLQGQSILIWTTKLANSTYSDLQNNGIYDAIGLSADFKCWLGAYDMKSGNYGLRLDIKVKVNNTENYIIKSFYLDSNEMFGNPYNFIAPSTQEKMFNITSVGTITEISLYFYQSSNFIYYDPNTEGLENIPVQAEYNIFVDNIKVALGTNIANVADNTLKIYTSSNTDFNYLNPIDQTNLKKIGLLWYNKNELNQYLGFSDGIVDFEVDQNGNFIPVDGEEDKYVIKPYDEIEYLQKSKKNTRWKSQLNKNNVPKDPAGLELAALTEEAFIAVEEIKTLINEDLINALENYQKKFKQRLPEAFTIIDNDYISPLQNGDTSFIKTFDTTLKAKKQYLEAMLAYVAQMQRIQNGESWGADNIEQPKSDIETNLVDLIGDEFEKLKGIHDIALDKFKALVSKDEYQNFTSSYDSFAKSINDIINLIKIKIEEVKQKANITDIQINEHPKPNDKEYTPLEEALSWYNINDYVGVYNPLEDSEHSNRYCIYWYRYVPGYIDPNPEFAFAGPEWERITKVQISSNEGEDSIYTIPNNLGLSNDYLPPKDGIYYWEKRPEKNEGMLNVYLEPKMHQEKFKAILFYNHDKYESEPIVFTNVDDITSIYADKTGALSIEHIEDSSDTYQTMYSANNFLTNRANAKKNRAVRAVYNGTLGTTEDVLVDTENPVHIYWYIPIENTMINVDLDYLAKPESEGGAGFTTNYVPTYRFKPGILEHLWKWNEWLKKQNNKQLEFLQDRPYGKQTIPNLYTFDEWIRFLQGKLDDIENPIAEYNNFEDLKLPNAFKGFKKVGNFLSLTEDFSMKELVRENETLTHSGGKWLPFPFKMKLPIWDDDNEEFIPGSEEEDLIEEIKDDEHHRDGYAYFYKKIEAIDYIKNADGEKEENSGIKDNEFFYQIKNYYAKNETNNQIICLVEKNGETFEASLNIAFGTQGTLGADYSFTIDPAGRQSAVHPDKSLQVNISLFDYDNNQIPIYEYDIAATEENDYAGIAYLERTNANNEENDNKSYIKWIGKPYDFNLKEDENNHVIGGEISYNNDNKIGSILQLTASFKNKSNNGNEITEETKPEGVVGNSYKKKKLSNITTFYSVPYATIGDFYIEGATSVIYDSNGNNPDYYKKPYKIFYNYYNEVKDENGKVIEQHSIGQEITDVEWEIAYYSLDDGEFNLVSDNSNIKFCENYLPVLNDNNTLTPCATYVDDGDSVTKYYAFIQCFNTPSKNERTLIWSQPIIVRKNRYAANMENSYDSSLAINLNSGTILSTLMNAFRRSGDGGKSLEGFAVGEMQYETGDNKLGLFGFSNGLQSFAFNTNGDISIGMPNSGQINFNSGIGVISSTSSVGNAETGLTIDLQDGVIDIFSTYKENTKILAETGGGIFNSGYTRQSYSKPGGGSESGSRSVFNSHIKINSASSKKEGFTQSKDKNQFPSWWDRIPSWITPKGRAVVEAIDDTQEDDAIFLIEVPSPGNEKPNRLISIGDSQCFIQSNNYTPGNYGWSLTEGTGDPDAEGMKIDLQYGFIDAYKLKISSNNILINSSGDTDPLFVVRASTGKNTNIYKNLLYIKDVRDDKGNETDTQFYIRSKTYDETEGKQTAGMEIDVTNGRITSYNFSLLGQSTNSDFNGSYIYITSENDGHDNSEEAGQPTLQFHLKKDDGTDIDLLKITPNTFVLHSTDYNSSNGTGLELDIGKGRIESYNFSLKGQATDSTYNGSYIWITSDTEPDKEDGGMPKIEFKLIENLGDSNNNISLLSISPKEFFLISPNFEKGTDGEGIKLDILKGLMEVKNKGVNLLSISQKKDDDENSKDSFEFISPDFEGENGNGIKLDILNGSIGMKSSGEMLLEVSKDKFATKFKQGDYNQFIIDSSHSEFPLQIGPQMSEEDKNLKFRINWDGTIYLGNSKFTITDDNSGIVTNTMDTTEIKVRKLEESQDTTGNITAEGYIHTKEAFYIGEKNADTNNVTIDSSGNIKASGNISSSSTIWATGGLYGKSLHIRNQENDGEDFVTIGEDGTITCKNIINGTNIDVSGQIAAEGSLIGQSLTIRTITNDTTKEVASITSDGTLRVKTVIADEIQGSISGSIGGANNALVGSQLTIGTKATITNDGKLTAESIKSNGNITLLDNAIITSNEGIITVKNKFKLSHEEGDDWNKKTYYTIINSGSIKKNIEFSPIQLSTQQITLEDGAEITVLTVADSSTFNTILGTMIE